MGRGAGGAGHCDPRNFRTGRVPHPTCDVAEGLGHACGEGGPGEAWCHGGADHRAHAVRGECGGHSGAAEDLAKELRRELHPEVVHEDAPHHTLRDARRDDSVGMWMVVAWLFGCTTGSSSVG